MENVSNISSEEELLQLRNEGKISEEEYQQLLNTMRKPLSDDVAVADEAGVTARLSKSAIWGAAWAPFFFILLLLLFMPHRVVRYEGQGPPGLTWWQYLSRFTVLLAAPSLIGLAAPFGTTILGLISISQIRHSAGKLYGLGLAVADTLVFPLLAMLGVTYWLVTLLNKILVSANIYGVGHPLNQKETILGVTLIIWGVLAWFFGRWVWRAANKPLKHSLE